MIVHRLIKAVSGKPLRFVIVGALNALIYTVTSLLLISALNFSPVTSSILAYAACLPAAFVWHRRVTFRSSGIWETQLYRFLVLQFLSLSLSAGSMALATELLELNAEFGIAIAVVAVPVMSYTLFNIWVFGKSG